MPRPKTILLWFVFLLLSCHPVTAQQYDKVWVLGFPMSTLTFDSSNVIPGTLPDTTLQSFINIANICDRNGSLLFYSNGVNIYNKTGYIMVNGDTLSAPSEYYSQVEQGGLPGSQEVVILPKPGDTSLYYVFHNTPTDTLDIADNAGYESLNLYYSIVDMRLDSGRGAVTQKNMPLIQNELISASRMAACQHANGRDWWIIKPVWHENIYYKFLLTPDGVQGPFVQQIGPLYGAYNEIPAYSIFSPDGSKYASGTAVSDIVLMDFDRCTGLFSNPDSIFNSQFPSPSQGSISGGANLAFSPNGRFLYASCPQLLNQYDLWSAQIHDSIRIETDTTEPYQINILQLAPNGKIYVSCWNGGAYAIHVINEPDSFGLSCNFQLFGQPVFSLNPQSLPYFPNFSLGALSGSPCDTLTDIQAIAAAHPAFATVTPNPAKDHAEIIYYTGSATSNQVLLYDINGKLIWSTNRSGSSGNINMDVSTFSAGIYLVKFMADGNVLLNTKLVIMR